MELRLVLVACLSAATAAGQFDGSFGMGISAPGGDVGTRGGDPVDIRFYAAAYGTYDNGLQPYAVDSKGNLVVAKGLYGEEVSLGAYGIHSWEHARLGLDYGGEFMHYSSRNSLSGTNQRLALDYRVQTSKRLSFQMKGTGGIFSQGLGALGGYSIPTYGVVDQPGVLLFDDRVYLGEGGASVSYLLSPHTTVTAGGQGFTARYRSAGLVGMNGYSARVSLNHRLSRHSNVGVLYERLHFDYSHAFGQSDVNSYEGVFETQLSRRWRLSIKAGAFQIDTQGLQQVPVDPVITALLGVTTTTATYHAQLVFPSGEVDFSRSFRRATLTLSYLQSIAPGNGVYLASRQNNGFASLSYTTTRKLSFFVSGGVFSYKSVAQNLQTYTQASGGAGLTYGILRTLHLTARYDLRHQDISSFVYNRTSYSANLGLAWSPGIYPLRLR